MWFVLAVTGLAIYFFSREKYPLEVISVGLLTVLLLFGQVFPLYGPEGRNLLDSEALLAGFANPALIAVLALLVLGQGVIQTDALRPIINVFVRNNSRKAWISITGILLLVLSFSAFLNNTPLVVIAIPILQALAVKAGVSESRIMIPLSYAAILGGMITLIGSSTNLLVSSTMLNLGYEPIGFFDFAVPGSILATVGFVYTIAVVPWMLSDRSSLARQLMGGEREFIAEIDVAPDSKLIGIECHEGRFANLSDLDVRLIQRSGHLVLPPFEGYRIEAGDILIVAAKRSVLTEMLHKFHGFFLAETTQSKDAGQNEALLADEGVPDLDKKVLETRALAEVMITPASRLIEMSLDQAGLNRQFGVIVLGIQRRARVVRRRLGRIRLESGDVLLVSGTLGQIDFMRNSSDLIVLSGSKRELPLPKKAPIAWVVFLGTIILAATGVLSIAVAAITGAVAMIATGCINVRQATRSIDRKIFLLVGSMLALGTAMQVTEGASYLAEVILSLKFLDTPLLMASMLFLLIAIMTNILSNNACAILFTPIAVNLALDLGVDPYVFAILVIFAANCSFASPMGYKTNLLVMGPGHYRFMDFFKGGVPLVIVIWITYILLAKFYYGL